MRKPGFDHLAMARVSPLQRLAEGVNFLLPPNEGAAVQRVVEGRYGLDALLTARTGTLSTTTALTTGERAMVWRAVPAGRYTTAAL